MLTSVPGAKSGTANQLCKLDAEVVCVHPLHMHYDVSICKNTNGKKYLCDSLVSRAKFEELCAGLLAKVESPLHSIMEQISES